MNQLKILSAAIIVAGFVAIIPASPYRAQAAGRVTILHSDNTTTVVNATTPSDLGNGTALLSAVASLSDGDVIELSADTFDIGNANIDFAQHAFLNVGSTHFTLKGAGKNSTTLVSSASYSDTDYIVIPSEFFSLSDMTIKATSTTNGAVPFGRTNNNSYYGSLNINISRASLQSTHYAMRFASNPTNNLKVRASIVDTDFSASWHGVYTSGLTKDSSIEFGSSSVTVAANAGVNSGAQTFGIESGADTGGYALPTELGHFGVSAGSCVHGTALGDNGLVYLTNPCFGLMYVVSVADPHSPRILSTVDISPHTGASYPDAYKLDKVGNYLYINIIGNDAQIGNVIIYDVTDPLAPTYAGITSLNINNLIDLKVIGSYLYAVSYTTNLLYTFDISDKTAPALLSTLSLDNGPSSIVATGTSLIIGGYENEKLAIVSLTDPANPTLHSYEAVTGNTSQILATSTYLYYLDLTNTMIRTYSISDLDNIVQLSATTSPANSGIMGALDSMVLHDGYIYANGTLLLYSNVSSFAIYDVSTLSTPRRVSNFVSYGKISTDFAVDDNYLYLPHSQGDTFRVYDLANLDFTSGGTILATSSTVSATGGSASNTAVTASGSAANTIKMIGGSVTSSGAGTNIDLKSAGSGVVYRSPNLIFSPAKISGSILELAQVFTGLSASSVTDQSVVLNASISADGAASSTDRGFYWGTTSTYGNVASTTGHFGIGSFSQGFPGLSCGLTYYFQAFSVNAGGTATSSGSTFTTSSCASASTGGSSSSGGGGGGGYVAPVVANQVVTNATTTVQCPKNLICKKIITLVPKIAFERDLYLGMVGNDVKELQTFLNNSGFVIASRGAGSKGLESTYFGSLTKSALIKYQKSRNIPATGYFGPLTRAAVVKGK